MAKYLDKLKSVFNLKRNDAPEIPTNQPDPKTFTSLNNSDMKRIVKSIYVPDTTSSGGRLMDKMQIPSMLEPISRELIDRRTDHAKLVALAPEINQASSILVPSILSPNDFQTTKFDVTIAGSSESEEVIKKVSEIISDHFGEKLDLSIRMSSWIDEALFKTGAKPIMILPTNSITSLRNNLGTIEALGANCKKFIDELSGAVEHFELKEITNCSYKDTDIVDQAIGRGNLINWALESMPAHLSTDDKQSQAYRVVKKHLLSGVDKAFSKFNSDKVIGFTTDPRIMFQPQLENASALESIDAKVLASLGAGPTIIRRDPKDGIASGVVNASYEYSPYLDLSEHVFADKVDDYPAMIELPYEAVVPIAIEGSPDNHIGYFVLLNQNGSPLSIDTDSAQTLADGATGSQRINNMYSAFYGSSYSSVQQRMATDAKSEILNSIYDGYLRNIMHSKLDTMGFSKYKVNLTEDMSRIMFYRLLKGMQTRVLYVPKRLMIYLAFDYHPDGTGKSKIDSIKFPLSLKITLIVTRLISLIESSINRRRLNITLDDSVGNPLEILRTVKKAVTQNKLYGISHDPSTIIRSILDKELTIIPDKIPGVDNFTITDEKNDVSYPRPDDAILDEIQNMYMGSLGVPPSAMNRLGEDEFSRSVATNNIFFSNQLKGQQKIVCKTITSLIHTYTDFSAKLKSTIEVIIKESSRKTETLADDNASNEVSEGEATGLSDTQPEKGEVETAENQLKLRVYELIRNIKFTLPAPNIAHDKSSFEELRAYMEIVDNVMSTIFADELTTDTELAATIRVVKAHFKKSVIKEYIKTNSMLANLNIDEAVSVNIVDIVGTNQKYMNLKRALDDLAKTFVGGEVIPGVEGGEVEENPPAAW